MLMGMLLNSLISLLLLPGQTQDTIALWLIRCVTPDILKQTKWHQVDAIYTKLSVQMFSSTSLVRGDI